MDRTTRCTSDISELFKRYADTLFRISYSELHSKADAEDIVQEVFCKFIKNKKHFNDIQHEKAWFIRVTINCCHDYLRHNKLRTYTPLDEIAEISHNQNNIQSIIENILNLDEKFKVVILLFYYEGLSINEISNILKISVSAVKMRLKRGKEMLKLDIEREFK